MKSRYFEMTFFELWNKPELAPYRDRDFEGEEFISVPFDDGTVTVTKNDTQLTCGRLWRRIEGTICGSGKSS